MDLLLGATMDPEGRSGPGLPAEQGHQGAFPLHAVPRGTTTAVCGAPVRELVEATWPPSQESRCQACEAALASGEVRPRSADPRPQAVLDQQNPVHPHGEP